MERVTYRCRDIGYGIEEGEIIGTWGDVDSWGKRQITGCPSDGRTLYLFPDEVLEAEPWAEPEPVRRMPKDEYVDRALLVYQQYTGDTTRDEDTLVGDFLAELLHYCDTYGVDFNQALERARGYYASEKGARA